MVAEAIVRIVLSHWPSIVGLTLIGFLIHQRYQNGLNKYPGPLLASFTNWWRFWDVYKRRPELTHIRLHRQLGDVVRLGPNYLSFGDPKALKSIYGLNKGFVKVCLVDLVETWWRLNRSYGVVRFLHRSTGHIVRSSPTLTLFDSIRAVPRCSSTMRQQRLLHEHPHPIRNLCRFHE